MARIGIYPSAEQRYLLPALRLARALMAGGHDVVLLGSDHRERASGHSDGWRRLLPRYDMADRVRVHADPRIPLAQWLVSASSDLELVAIDAGWQGLAFAWGDAPHRPQLRIIHAGLPDFRRDDCPPGCFIMPAAMSTGVRAGLHRDPWVLRTRRAFVDVAQAACPTGQPALHWEDGCTEPSRMPAERVQLLAPCMELPGEAGRTAYAGTCLPGPSDIDWDPPWSAGEGAERPLVVCAFGIRGLAQEDDRAWALRLADDLARRFRACEVVAVLPGASGDRMSNLTVVPWMPLWPTLRARSGRTVLVSSLGVGAWREASAAGVPVVAIPRVLDQFGAAARVAHFGTGLALVGASWPTATRVAEAVAELLEDARFAGRAQAFAAAIASDSARDPYPQMVTAGAGAGP